MRPGCFSLLGIIFLTFVFVSETFAEPWISNRFSQNCAGCHAPGRMNKSPSKRRCTLSCQGCHANPNGGGMRNFYGQWNQRRWLKSFSTGLFIDEDPPAPYNEQNYSGGKILRTVERVESEASYSRDSYGHWTKNAETEEEFLAKIPEDDPYFQQRRTPVLAGGDIRYIVLTDISGVPNSRGKVSNWLMATDIGVQLRPYPEYASIVLEGRFLNRPGNAALDEGFTTESRPKSAFVLVDDLPYNTYVMGGLFRPMFGHYSPDHTSLSSTITGLGSRALNKGVSIGAAPNVPFANVSFISPINGSSSSFDKSTGFIGNVGGRFVTLGASIVGSVWISDEPDGAGARLDKRLYALSGGLKYGDFIFNLELLRFRIEAQDGVFDEGNVYTGELRYRLWRETYAVTRGAISNVALNRGEGNSHSAELGLRSFLAAGTDLEVSWANSFNNQNGSGTRGDSIRVQGHVFF